MTPLHHHLSTVEFDKWRELYRRAVAAGCAWVIDADDERVAAPDELVALALPGLVRLGAFALLADSTRDLAPECAQALRGEAGAVLRLLDRALAAHGRDHGYPVAAWLEYAVGAAHAAAGAVSRLEVDAMPLSTVCWTPLTPSRQRLSRCTATAWGSPASWRTRSDRCLCFTWPPPARSADPWLARVASRLPPRDPPGVVGRAHGGGCHRGSRLRSKASHD